METTNAITIINKKRYKIKGVDQLPSKSSGSHLYTSVSQIQPQRSTTTQLHHRHHVGNLEKQQKKNWMPSENKKVIAIKWCLAGNPLCYSTMAAI